MSIDSKEILSDIIVHMKYAKYIPELKRRETFNEMIDRNKNMHIKNFPNLKDKIEEIYKEFVYTKKVLPSMRALQFSGKPIEVNPVRQFNCSYLPIDDWRAFGEVMFLLLSGTGVGFSVQNHHIEKLPVINKPNPQRNKRFLVGDSIEGWSDAIKVLMKSYFNGTSTINFDYSDIRPKGSHLITAGGKAPGPDPLRLCIEKIRSILDNKNTGDQLAPIEVHDILCHIADAVLAGGIRRSATISFFSADDHDMISCKSGNWWELNPQRGRANNSVVLLRSRLEEEDFKELWLKVEASKSGEPGIFLTNDKDILSNPCVTGDTEILVRTNLPTTNEHKALEGHLLPIKEVIEKLDELEDIEVYSYNVDTKKTEWKRIEGGQLTKRNAQIMELEIENNDESISILRCTPDHKIYTTNRGYVEAQHLKEEDNLVILRGDKMAKLKSRKILEEKEDVYDIKVKDNENFFANGVLVHNCAEISLKPNSFCNLNEVNISDVDNQEELNNRVKAAAFIGTLQASYTNFHYLRPQWQRTTEKDALLGIGLTGIAGCDYKLLNFKEAAKLAIQVNEEMSKEIGINKAARITTIKPSGTAALVLGTSSGVHAYHNDYYIRRIRVGKDEAIYSYLKEKLPKLVEDDFFRPHDTGIISIPVKAPDNALLRTETPVQTLRRVKWFHQNWIKPGHNRGSNTHNVSCTISIKDNEWEKVGEWMWKNRNHYTGLSVLPYDGGTYKQAPFENCTKEVYEEMMKYVNDIDLKEIIEETDQTSLQQELACSGGSCEVF